MCRCNGGVRRYLREVRAFIPGSRKQKKRIISCIEGTIYDYMTESRETDYAMLVSRFGTPQQIASAYVEEMDASELITILYNKKRYLNVLLALSAAIILIWLSIAGTALVQHYEQVDGYYDVYIDEGYNISENNGGK